MKFFRIAVLAVLLSVVLSLSACGLPASSPAGGGGMGAGTLSPSAVSASPTQTETPAPVETAAATAAPTPSPSPAAPTPEATATPASTPTPTVDPMSQYFTDGSVFFDATTYRSADLYVKVTNVYKGGQNYYVADVRTRDISKLFTAFSGNGYSVKKNSERTSVIARRHGAVIAINGDYYNARKQGLVIRNGMLYRPTPYYDVAAIFADGTMKTYTRSQITAKELIAEGCVQAFGFGPKLMDGKGNALSAKQLNSIQKKIANINPRTGIGYFGPNHFAFVVVDGRKPKKGMIGMTFVEFANLFKSLGCKEAYNLDGGGSSAMVFMGKVLNHPCDAAGERKISDILYFGESATDKETIARYGK